VRVRKLQIPVHKGKQSEGNEKGDLENLSGNHSILQGCHHSNRPMPLHIRLNPDNLFARLIANPQIVLERIAIPEIPIK
jgi:hypothetical protein